MSDGTKLAVAILVMWIALVFFFFAFHPGGVKNVSNPGQMLKWLMDEFAKLAGGTQTAASLTADVSGTTNDLSYPGYTSGSSDTGTVNPGGVQLA
ncbi:MAG TPA: hypothetical protein VHY59_07200 [Chthoniobacterales bacterium]|jgi:hypothetical protein|nr:hypothetical protein [Chthoniobacterales bacterium]